MEDWPDIENCKEKSRRELTLRDCPKRFEEIECSPPKELYTLTLINFLEISGCELSSVSEDIGNLQSLAHLVLTRNKLKQLPLSLSKLSHLKVLDASNNEICEIPANMGKLSTLQTLNLNSNCLSHFPDNLEGMTSLSVLDLSSNQFTAIPEIFMHGNHPHLSEMKLSHNLIEDIADGIGMLEALKSLDLSSNKIKELPQVISNCSKLKNADYTDNPLKDRRLKKLIEQKNSSQKAIMDYIKSKGRPTKLTVDGPAKTKTGKKKGVTNGNEEALVKHIMKVLRFDKPSTPHLEIIVTDDVKDVRPYIVCCIAKRLDLSSDILLKKFLAVQTKMHDGPCAKRTVATIASHDVPSLEDVTLCYSAKEPDLFSVKPLGRGVEVTALQLYKQLKMEADEIRKDKKKNQVSGIYKYLTLLEKHEKFPFLSRSLDGTVISLPPLTNSDVTRMKVGENDILLEVTSSQNLGSCKNVMDKLIQMMAKEGLYSCRERDFYSDSSDDEKSTNKETPCLVLQQVRILDSNGKLKVLYPSRTDLDFTDPAIKVERVK